MKEKSKNNSLNKKLLKGSEHYYSNKAVFERREKSYNSQQNIKIKNKKLFGKTLNFFKNKNKKPKEDLIVPLCKTMSSFYQPEQSYNILPLLDYMEKNMLNKKKKKVQYKKDLFCKTERNYNEKNLFKTEITSLTSKYNKTNNIFDLNNLSNDKEIIRKDSNVNVLLLIQSSRNETNKDKNKTDNNKNLKLNIESYLNKKNKSYKNYAYTQTTRNKNFLNKDSDEYTNYISTIKHSKYNNNISLKDYINKIHQEKIYIHTSKAKTERLKRLQESNQSQNDFYEDSIKSFIIAKKLFENNFVNKVADYARFISSTREREKIKQSLLRQEIIDYKKDIDQIKAKINKIEIDKKNIIKWIFLQIRMKEKLLILPEYYKFIIASSPNVKSSKRLLLRGDAKIDSSFKEKRKLGRKQTTKLDLNVIKILKSKDSINNNTANVKHDKNTINPEEYKRILNYKNNLIYKTPEEFEDRLTGLEKGNLALLQYKDILNGQLFKFKKELESQIIERNRYEMENQKIGVWENELKIIKKMADTNSKLVSDFKKNNINYLKKKEEKKNELEGQVQLNVNNNQKNEKKFSRKNDSLFNNIYSIFEKCHTIGSHLKYTAEILNQINRKINAKEKEMLLMLEFIEQTVDYLIMSIKKKSQNSEIKQFIKKMKSDIEKDHKLEKAKIQMMIDIKKITSLEEKVNKRYNKVYFLPKRRISVIEFKVKNKEKEQNRKLSRKLNIKDFIYDEESSKEV